MFDFPIVSAVKKNILAREPIANIVIIIIKTIIYSLLFSLFNLLFLLILSVFYNRFQWI